MQNKLYDLSIVTCSYNAENTIENFIKQIDHICKNILKIQNFEIIVTDDFSKDNTVNILKKLITNNYPIKLITLSKNCGNHYAMKQSIKNSSGKNIFEIDSDLEISTSYLEIFWESYKNEKKPFLVFGIQQNRNKKSLINFLSTFYYYFINFFSDIKIPINQLQIRIYCSTIKDTIIKNFEEGKQNSKYFHELNFPKKKINVEKIKSNKTNYTVLKRIRNFINGIILDTDFLFKFLIYLLILVFVIIISLIIFIIRSGLIYSILNSGWFFTSLILLLFMCLFVFISGVVILFMKLILSEVRLQKTDYIYEKINFSDTTKK